MRSRTLFALLLVPIAAAGSAVAGPRHEATAAPPAEVVFSDEFWLHQEQLGRAAETVEPVARRQWPESYAGLEVDVPANVLVVRRVPGNPGIDRALRALVPVSVRLIDAVYPERQVDAWTERLRADRGYWQEQRGIEIIESRPDPGRCVSIGLDDPERDGPALIAHYRQTMAVCVEKGYRAELLALDR
ncbi:hypothetical protein [Micromonospora yangpuensis]|uniref:Uncharacterized protein n=1 Tax=Micromonospora yangpuensis TaxID=683228 RepID=A0A1C6UF99_9ACTN|nr:hypothetical protein [Micromonospora yangpuensis]GGM05963.1 hypothetical protein GCM10012279_24650 [Micromonospora yangpuensis]SCL52621.1 hypothetical protein GA0070617_2132 [Micromonospora yangpuensis]